MWVEVKSGDTELMERWCRVIRAMSADYAATMDVGELHCCMGDETGCTWFYQGDRFEIALRFHYIAKRDHYQLANVGFLGQIEAAVALDIVIEKCHSFLEEHGYVEVISLRPNPMDNPRAERFFQLVPKHPLLEVKVLERWRGMLMLRVAHLELLARRRTEPTERTNQPAA